MRLRRAVGCVFGIAAAVGFSGCGKSPTSPGGGFGPGLASAPLSPADGTVVGDFGQATFTASNPSVPDGVVLITFEFAPDSQFRSPFRTSVVRQDAGDQTALVTDTSFGVPVGQRVYWRVRAGTGEAVGAWSRAAHVVIGPRVDPVQLYAEPPTLLSPVNVTIQQRGVALRARLGAHSGGPVGLRFQLSTSPGFSNPTPCIGSLTPDPSEHSCPMGSLAPGTYFWRAQTVATRSGSSLAEGVSSAFSPTATFTVAPADIRAPQSLSPVMDGIESTRPTIVFKNATRSGDVGPLVYRFEIRTSGAYSNSPVITSGLIPEGQTSTSWTVPIDLMVETTYTALVYAIDSTTGFESPAGRSWEFLVIGSQYSKATLSVTSSCRSSTTMPAAFLGRVGDSPFVVRTASSLVLNLHASGLSRQWTGTIGGGTTAVSISAGDGVTPAQTTVVLQADGTLAGTAHGVAGYSSFIEFFCPPGPIDWFLRPS